MTCVEWGVKVYSNQPTNKPWVGADGPVEHGQHQYHRPPARHGMRMRIANVNIKSTAAMHSCVALENSWLWLVGSDLWHVKPTARACWHCASVQLD